MAGSSCGGRCDHARAVKTKTAKNGPVERYLADGSFHFLISHFPDGIGAGMLHFLYFTVGNFTPFLWLNLLGIRVEAG